MLELGALISFAFLLDLLLGDPRYRLHPIRMVGWSISFLEKGMRRIKWDGRAAGLLLLCLVLGASLTAYLCLRSGLDRVHSLLGLGVDLFVCYSCVALKDLVRHIVPVIHALERCDLERAGEAIGLMVGREVGSLDRVGVSRAGVETLAENAVDGFISPLFWFVTGGIAARLLGGVPVVTATGSMLAFKVVSTLDSMVGHKDSAFRYFGWAGARLDDAMNFLPARLSIIPFFLGAWACGLHPVDGLRTALRDRLKHDSPNAAHGESFAAGALHVRLGGPAAYAEGWKAKPWLGQGYPDPGPAQVRQAGRLVQWAAWISMGGALLITAVLLGLFP